MAVLCDILILSIAHLLQYLMVVMLAYLFGSEGGRQTLTFMTNQKTWNEARAICGMNGGHLLKDSKAKTTTAVYELGVIEPWLSQAFLSSHFWIGLFCTGIVNTGSAECIFAWSNDCSNLTSYRDWHPSEPVIPETNQCVYRKETGIHQNWHTSLCSKHKYYICQNDDGIPCNVETMVGMRGKAHADQTYMTIDFSVCRANCKNMTCIAYAYNLASGTCYLYIDFSLSHFNVTTNLQEDSEYTLYIRQCYNIAIDANLYTNITNNDTGVTQNCMEPVTTMTSLPTTVYTTEPEATVTTTMFEETTFEGTVFATEPEATVTTTMFEETTFEETVSATESEATVTTTMFEETTFVGTNTTKQCQCLCTFSNTAISAGQLQQKITNLQSQLSVHKSSLSSTRRKLTSAHDDRKLSAGLGYIAVLFLILVVGVMVLSDLTNVFVALNIWKKSKPRETYTIEL